MIKKSVMAVATAGALLSSSYAGHEMVSSGKDYKGTPPVEVSCFGDHELQLDVFGAYADGNAPVHAGPIRDHGWGGGVGINYFFSRWIGIGADATWLYAHENGAAGGFGSTSDSDQTVIHNFSGSLIARFPSDTTCLAPYLFLGGGFHVDGEQWASAHGGVGIEYRVVPNRVGIFADARFTYFGDRFGYGDQNNFMGRAGVRFVF